MHRNLQLLLVAICCASPAAVGQTSPADYKASGARTGEALHRLAGSVRVEDRLEAAKAVSYEFEYPAYMPILWKLLRDEDPSVQGEAAYSISNVLYPDCVTRPPELSKSDVGELVAYLQASIPKDRGKLTKRFEGTSAEIWLMGCRVLALNSLCLRYPIFSREEYAHWQEKTLFSLLLALKLSLILDPAEKNDLMWDQVVWLLARIDEPDVAVRALDSVLDDIALFPPEQAEDTVFMLSKHLLFGPGRPLHDHAVKVMSPHLPGVRARVLATKPDLSAQQSFESCLDNFSAPITPADSRTKATKPSP